MSDPRRINEVLSGSDTQGRVPPQAVDIESAVLGAMLLDKEALAKAFEVLDSEAFYKPAHGLIFKAMTALFEKSEPVDLITLAEELRRRGDLEKVGGEYVLTELTGRVASAANIEYHAHIVLEKSLMRQLIASSSEVIQRAYLETEDALGLLDQAETKIFDISEQRMKKSFVTMGAAVTKTMALLESIHGSHSGVTGVPAGFTDLDNLTGGFQASDLIIVAGRPSQGKTALVLSLARNASVLHDVPIAFFSLEMSVQQLVMRLMCAEARVDAHKVRTGRLPEDEWRKLSVSVGRLYKAKIFIDDTPSLGILELRAKARRLKAEHNIGLVIVDYLQLMQGPRNAQSREQEISAISRSLKALAKELNIPVIALSQLNRSVEARTDKRPALADLRESGAIEQDADVVLFVHRPEMYGLEAEGGEATEGMAEIIIGKQRNGPTDTIKLQFVKQYARFENRLQFPREQFLPPPSEPGRTRFLTMATRSLATVALIVLTLAVADEAVAQEGTWSVSAVAGVAFLQFDQVDQDGRNDVDSYRALGVPIGDYPALRVAPLVQAAAHYRFERDMGASFFGQYQQARTTTILRDSLHFLSLDRRLTSVLFGTDIAYYFPPIQGGIEAGLFVGMGYLWATADQITNETVTVKTGPTTEQRLVQDAYAKYKKAKLVVRAGGTVTVPFTSSTALLAGAMYQHAPLGSMSGTLREYVPADGSILVRPHETAVEFNYSTLQLTLGIVYLF